MKLIGICRLGADAELRYGSTGDPVANFNVAFNYGRKDSEGKQPSQWVTMALWGNRAEKLAEHLLKGTQLFIVASDVHVETYEKRDGGTGSKLVARVDDLQFAGSRQDRDEGQQQRQQAQPPAQQRTQAPAQRQAAPKTGTGFDDLDSDIPFVSSCESFDLATPLQRRMRRYRGVR